MTEPDTREYVDVDTWHFHWENGDANANKEYKCSSYKVKP